MLHRGASGREVQSHLGLGNLALVDRYSKSFAVENGGTIKRGPEMAPYVVSDASRDAPVFRTSKPNPNLPENLPLNLPLKGTFRDTSPDSDGQTGAHEANGHASQKLLKKAEKAGVLTKNAGSDIVLRSTGEVAEWLNAPVSKTGLPARVARVRISPSPFFAVGVKIVGYLGGHFTRAAILAGRLAGFRGRLAVRFFRLRRCGIARGRAARSRILLARQEPVSG